MRIEAQTECAAIPRAELLLPLGPRNEGEQRLEALHHPFTAPNAADVAAAGGDLRTARAMAYDLVLNGNEIGGEVAA